MVEGSAPSLAGVDALVSVVETSDPAHARAHELFKPDEKAPARRSLRYTVAAAVLAVAMVGAGISLRNANGSQQPFVDAMLAKYPYWRELVQKVSY